MACFTSMKVFESLLTSFRPVTTYMDLTIIGLGSTPKGFNSFTTQGGLQEPAQEQDKQAQRATPEPRLHEGSFWQNPQEEPSSAQGC
jgi:hypothetical protein